MRVERPPLLFPILPAICESRVSVHNPHLHLDTQTLPMQLVRALQMKIFYLLFDFKNICTVYKLADHKQRQQTHKLKKADRQTVSFLAIALVQ